MANNSAGTKLGAASNTRILSQDVGQDLGRVSGRADLAGTPSAIAAYWLK